MKITIEPETSFEISIVRKIAELTKRIYNDIIDEIEKIVIFEKNNNLDDQILFSEIIIKIASNFEIEDDLRKFLKINFHDEINSTSDLFYKWINNISDNNLCPKCGKIGKFVFATKKHCTNQTCEHYWKKKSE